MPFNPTDDTIQLENDIFKKFTTSGKLNENILIIGASAVEADDYIIYNSETGQLFYDADGNGDNDSIEIAQIGVKLALTHDDFIVV